jgi:hypothetical protein
MTRYRHVALLVSDLRGAEEYHIALFIGVRWQLSDTQPFRSAGERDGIWLNVED